MHEMDASYFSSDTFFREYWGKKALHIPRAIKDFSSPISTAELAGLACEACIESRIVLEKTDPPWQVRHGHFPEDIFHHLPESHWSLLVQAVNLWDSDVNNLLKYFDFFPRHFLDDIMVSYASPHGSVGPHFDYYDVFILQGSGQRLWQLGNFCSSESALLEDTEMAILANFHEQERYTLNTGDILYIPVQQSHWCTCIEPGTSFSIGYRAPSMNEFLNNWLNHCSSLLDESIRLPMTMRQHQSATFIPEKLLDQLELNLKALAGNRNLLIEALAEQVTEKKYPDDAAETQPISRAQLLEALQNHDHLIQAEAARFAWHQKNNRLSAYCNGQKIDIGQNSKNIIPLLFDNRIINNIELRSFLNNESALDVLHELVNSGAFYFE